MTNHIAKSLAVLVLGLTVLMPVGRGATADDTALFTAAVPPNVMMMVDNSGSMNNIVWHPEYDPSVDPSCNYYNDSSTYSYSSNWTATRCGNSRTIYEDPDIGNSTRVTGRYLNWLFSDESAAYQAEIASTNNGVTSACLVAQGEPATYAKYRRSRITAARQVLREVICQVNAVGEVRFGISKFYRGSDPKGGYVSVPIDDYDADHGAHLDQGALLDDEIDELEGEAWTPLAEALYNVYRYFQSRTKPAYGKDGSTTFPWYNIETDGDTTGSVGNTPPSPVQYACQKNFVIVITDGEPTRDDFDNMDRTTFQNKLIGDYNPDNDEPEDGDEIPGCCSENGWYLDDVAMYMHQNDFHREFDGDQTLDVYTVGFTTEGNANSILEKTANVGNGLFFQSNNAEELADAIVTAVTDIIEKSQSFTAATVPASRATDGNNFYASFFLPSGKSAYWEGHIKNFEFNAAGEIRDKMGNCAVDDSSGNCISGPLDTTAPAYWDAYEEIPSPASRKLYVSDYGAGPPAATPTLPPLFTTANVSATDLAPEGEALGVSPNEPGDFPDNTAASANDLRDRIVDYVRGCEWDSSPCVERDGKLWDIFHSNPLLIGSPNAGHHSEGYIAFAQKYRRRDRVLYAGSNGGFLHGFHAGAWDTSLDPDSFNRGTGKELMGFMPYPARQNVKELARDRSAPKHYFVDGSVQAADVWLPASPTDAATASPDEWHTVLVGNMRQGGNVVFALDVTDPPSTSNPNGLNAALDYPGYLWEFPCEADAARCKGGGDYDYADYMADTWSDPIITKIKIRVGDDDNDGQGYDRWVAIFAAGYDEAGDPNVAAAYDATHDEDTSRKGRAIFVVDVATGVPLAMKRYSHNSFKGETGMRYAMTASPAVFDVDFDGYADVAYFTDLGGNVWKWVLTEIAKLPSSDADLDQPDWEFVHLFQADHCSFAVEGPDCPEDHYRSFFFPPTGALVHGSLWLAFGSGERNNLRFAGYPDSERENNRFYVMKDVDPLEEQDLGGEPRYTDLASSDDFFEASDANRCDVPSDPHVGYYITAEDSEKFITNSVIFFGTVFSLSFIPEDSGDPCKAGGTAFLYGFDLFCGEGIFVENEGEPDEDHKRIFEIGDGVPNRPRVSVGPIKSKDCVGDECDPCEGPDCDEDAECENKVVVITSDGTAFSDSPTNQCPSGIRLNSWRDF
ncbi:MAG: pilus assembly protein [Myxococcota bacterium]